MCPSAVVAKKTKVKKEKVVVKAEDGEGEGEGEVKVQGKLTVEVDEIKAEDVEPAIPDIEDIGKERRRTPRKRG
jgi:endonuclease-3